MNLSTSPGTLTKPKANPPISLENFESFCEHPWVESVRHKYKKDSLLAEWALVRLRNDLEELNRSFHDKHQRTLFVTAEGRVKKEPSLLKKLYEKCQIASTRKGLTQKVVADAYSDIKDLCGARFSVPYYDEVLPAVNGTVRRRLQDLGYATNLAKASKNGFSDKNYLEGGDANGYRSYHFYIKIPTPVDIFGTVELCLCEVQARTELQHVWAVKSHDLLYKNEMGWMYADQHVIEDMKQLSNSLRAADQLLLSIRDRSRGGKGHALAF